MKLSIYQSAFVKFEIDPDLNLLYEKWLLSPSDELRYKEEMLEKAKLMQKYRPQRVLDDVSNTSFSIHPDLQEWTEQLLNPIFRTLGIDKYAIILPSELFAQISLEQTVDDTMDN